MSPAQLLNTKFKQCLASSKPQVMVCFLLVLVFGNCSSQNQRNVVMFSCTECVLVKVATDFNIILRNSTFCAVYVVDLNISLDCTANLEQRIVSGRWTGKSNSE